VDRKSQIVSDFNSEQRRTAMWTVIYPLREQLWCLNFDCLTDKAESPHYDMAMSASSLSMVFVLLPSIECTSIATMSSV
jgi:hypothetical protein